jgi:hypothetical protein
MNPPIFDRSKTLEELEEEDWGDPPFSSHVVTESHRLRKVPVEQLRIEDLRLLIGQSIGLEYLVPIALEKLEHDPWASGDFYKGDLLQKVMRLPPAFWRTHQELVDGLLVIFGELRQCRELLEDELLPAWFAIYRALYNADPPEGTTGPA